MGYKFFFLFHLRVLLGYRFLEDALTLGKKAGFKQSWSLLRVGAGEFPKMRQGDISLFMNQKYMLNHGERGSLLLLGTTFVVCLLATAIYSN